MVDKGTPCSRCGEVDNGEYGRSLVKHHILPLSQGGEDKPENIEYLCLHCHGVVHYWSGKVDDPPRNPTDQLIRLDVDTWAALEYYRRDGEKFSRTIRRLLEVISRYGKETFEGNQTITRNL